MATVMGFLVGNSQADFVPGRFIHDNTIMAQELIRGYSQKNISSRCMIKMDLQKAYDSIQWSFVEHLLRQFVVKFFHLLMEERGFDKEIPSPLSCSYYVWNISTGPSLSYTLRKLFVTILSVKNSESHTQLLPTTCCFFSKSTLPSIMALLQVFDDFSRTSGLIANRQKCEIYFGGMPIQKQLQIAVAVQLKIGKLPFRYLGIPLNGKRLSISQYQPLIEKMVSRIRHWTVKFLSYGGRLQLVQSVLYAIQHYWSQLFPLPKKVLKAVNTICRQFLWSGDIGGRKSRVAWDDVCKPRTKGGLGLRHLETWNKAVLLKLLWAIHMKEDKLWVKWVHIYYVKEGNIMDMQCPSQASYLLRKLLKMRTIQNCEEWQTQVSSNSFCLSKIYLSLRPASMQVSWKELSCSNSATPKARFIFWLACWGRLATRDLLINFGVEVPGQCVFCDTGMESVAHVLFECPSVYPIWQALFQWYGRSIHNRQWLLFLQQLCFETKGKTLRNGFLKVLVTELVYGIWKERNKRIFEEASTDLCRVLRTAIQDAMIRCGNTKFSPICSSFVNYPLCNR
ncbi:hypothetical protein OROGR_020078 [Orobanche gracilis]